MENRFGYEQEDKPYDKYHEEYVDEQLDNTSSARRDVAETLRPLLENLDVDDATIKELVEKVVEPYAGVSYFEGLVHRKLISGNSHSKENTEGLKDTVEKINKLSEEFYYLPYYLARVAVVNSSLSQAQLCLALGGISRPTLDKRMRRAMEIFDRSDSNEELFQKALKLSARQQAENDHEEQQ